MGGSDDERGAPGYEIEAGPAEEAASGAEEQSPVTADIKRADESVTAAALGREQRVSVAVVREQIRHVVPAWVGNPPPAAAGVRGSVEVMLGVLGLRRLPVVEAVHQPCAPLLKRNRGSGGASVRVRAGNSNRPPVRPRCTRSAAASRSDSSCEPASITTDSRFATLRSTTTGSRRPPTGGTAPSSKSG
jgi:hypothetical protein